MQRVRKMLAVPSYIEGEQAKVTIAVLDTGEGVAEVPGRMLGECHDMRLFLIDFWGKTLYNTLLIMNRLPNVRLGERKMIQSSC